VAAVALISTAMRYSRSVAFQPQGFRSWLSISTFPRHRPICSASQFGSRWRSDRIWERCLLGHRGL